MTTPWAHIDDAVDRYCTGFDQLSAGLPKLDEKPVVPAVVLLTGSTGHIGSHLLSTLVHDVRVGRIYCLNRVSTSGMSLSDRQRKTLQELRIDETIMDSPKVILLQGSVTEVKLGLADEVFTQVRVLIPKPIQETKFQNIDRFIHPLQLLFITRGTKNLLYPCPHLSQT
jgi:hypothetical protein